METAGRYQLLDRIAQGGMAELYRARAVGEAGFSKIVAVKRILPGHAADPGFEQMLLDEARLAASLSHPNVVQVFELGRDAKGLFVAMEYVHGPNLAGLLKKLRDQGRAMQVPLALEIAVQALMALDYVHRRADSQGRPLQLVHRDVSPDNLLIDELGVVKLSDFGIAKALNNLHHTKTGALKGKLPYMSPEQARGEPVDARTDVFAAGLVLWESLAGQRHYRDLGEAELVKLVGTGAIRPLTEAGVQAPPELERALGKALAANRDDRWQTAGDFGRELASIQRRLYPDHLPGTLGELVRELFAARLEQLAQRLRQIEAEETGPTAPALLLGDEALGRKPEPKAPVRAPITANGVPTVDSPPAQSRPVRPRPPAPITLGPADNVRLADHLSPRDAHSAAIDEAIGQAEREDRAAASAARRSKGTLLAGSFLLAAGLAVGGIALYEELQPPWPKLELQDSPILPPDGSVPAATVPGEPAPRAPAASADRPKAKPPKVIRLVDPAAPGVSATGEGTFDLDCKPECEVELDGERVGMSPLKLSVGAGLHTLKVSNRLVNLRRSTTFEVEKGQTAVRRINLVTGEISDR